MRQNAVTITLTCRLTDDSQSQGDTTGSCLFLPNFSKILQLYTISLCCEVWPMSFFFTFGPLLEGASAQIHG